MDLGMDLPGAIALRSGEVRINGRVHVEAIAKTYS